MEKLYENIIGIIVTIIPLLLLVFKQIAPEMITNLIKELFNNKTKKSANNTFNSFIILILILGIVILIYPYFYNDTHYKPKNSQEQSQGIAQKTESPVKLDAVKFVYDEINNVLEKKKERNEEIIANREMRLVFQIGEIKDNEKAIINLYNKLKNDSSIKLNRLFVFKIQRNKYFLYEDDNYNENQIYDSLENFRSKIYNIEPNIEIINLLDYCKAKENITETKSIINKKEKIEIPCCNCDKQKNINL